LFAVFVLGAAITLPMLLVLLDCFCDPYDLGRSWPFTIVAVTLLLSAIGIAITGSWDFGAVVLVNAFFVGTTALFIREQQS
jgi:hypothetical protein